MPLQLRFVGLNSQKDLFCVWVSFADWFICVILEVLAMKFPGWLVFLVGCESCTMVVMCTGFLWHHLRIGNKDKWRILNRANWLWCVTNIECTIWIVVTFFLMQDVSFSKTLLSRVVLELEMFFCNFVCYLFIVNLFYFHFSSTAGLLSKNQREYVSYGLCLSSETNKGCLYTVKMHVNILYKQFILSRGHSSPYDPVSP